VLSGKKSNAAHAMSSRVIKAGDIVLVDCSGVRPENSPEGGG